MDAPAEGNRLTNAAPYQLLLDSLREGWAVQMPVYYRQRWYSSAANRLGYYFILKKGDQMDLIIVPDDEKVRELIGARKLKVVAS